MLFHCVSFTFLFISSRLLTVIALPAVTQTTTVAIRTDETDMKQLRSFHELNTMKIEVPDSRWPTQIPKHLSATSSGEEEEEEEEEESGYEEMVSYRSCQVSDMTYRHREQIPRSDPCEICVCVDSEMYCLWKMCSHQSATTQTSTSTDSSKSPTESDNKKENRTSEIDPKINEIKSKNDKFTEILTRERKYNALKKLEVTSPKNSPSRETTTATTTTTKTTTTEKPETSSPEPTVCYVMGVMYKLGEVLPRDTGTCLECSCSEGARVTCRPKDCVSQPDLDYLSHNNNLDMFDLDSF